MLFRSPHTVAIGRRIAHLLGLPVPHTVAIGRRIAPFSFGQRTGTSETWIRTCPKVPVAGKYPTLFGWDDPFAMFSKFDPTAETLASVLAQESVDFVYSGAALTAEGGVIIEGRSGRGDAFMVGEARAEPLPRQVRHEVTEAHRRIAERLHAVKFEWVWDGRSLWIVQLHRRPKGVSRAVVYSGTPAKYVTFRSEEGLEKLRDLVKEIADQDTGVILVGEVGVTSHLGDILRESKIPSRIEWYEHEANAV